MTTRQRLGLASLVSPSDSYTATVVRVVDGDTIHCDIVMGSLTLAGLDADVVLRDMPVRLEGCNAAEHNTPGGAAAKENLTQVLPVGLKLVLSNCVSYKYGNNEIVAKIATPTSVDLIADLIKEQWVAPWNGEGARPTPPWPRTVS